MRAGYKVAVAGLAAVLGCAVVALASPNGAGSPGADVAAQAVVLSASDGGQAAQYRDGVYRASAQGKGGEVPVTVTVSGGRISDIVVGQNSEVPAMAAKAQSVVIPQIIESQSTEDVEAATGATFTSNAIVEAVSKALSYAEA